MKKTVLGMAALAALSLASCGGNNSKCNGAAGCDSKCDEKVEIFSGVLPAADAEGVRYTLKLEYDDDHNFTDGDYDLDETYLVADSTATDGMRADKSFKSEGDFSVTDKDGKKVYKLVPDVKDSNPEATLTPMYFVLDNDSTLTLVNDKLERAANPDMNYSLKLAK